MTEEQKSEIKSEEQPLELQNDAVIASDVTAIEASAPVEKKKSAKQSKTKVKGKKKKKKVKQNVVSGRAYISATYNNTIVTLTDQKGDVISWASAGNCGFKGPKKATPYAAQIIVKKAVDAAKEYGLKEVNVFIKGVGTGRESAARALNANGLNVIAIKDMTPIPHNGCRPRKPRRV